MFGLAAAAAAVRSRPKPWAALAGAAMDLDFVRGKGFGAQIADLSVTRASPGTAETASGTWVPFSAGELRRTDKGVLIEESRTNMIRNSAAQGAAIGGAFPTHWSSTTLENGITKSVVGIGTEDGIDYVDVRFQGVATLGYVTLGFENSVSGLVADTTYTMSGFIRLLAGSFSGFTISKPFLRYNLLPSGSTDLVPAGHIFPTNARLSSQRFAFQGTPVGTISGNGNLFWQWNFSAGSTIDFTIRFGWPQLEVGAFATSPIRTTGSTATRAADSVKLTSLPWLNPAAGTLYAHGGPEALDASAVIKGLTSLDDNTSSNRIGLRKQTVGASINMIAGNVGQTSWNFGSLWTDASAHKLAHAYASNDGMAADNGVLGAADTALTVPTVTQLQIGIAQGAGALNGYLKRVAYFPSRLSDVALQTLTAV